MFHTATSAVLLFGALTTSVATQERAGTRAAYLGTYGSVTESECNVELELLDRSKARIIVRCRLEDGSHQDAAQTTQATWSLEGDRLTVEYESQGDLLEYDPHLSYEDFGQQGSGPGLKLLDPVGSSSRLHGFGHLWKRPLSEKKHHR
jgi:hypothetical protein